jgi:hypothetical protein
MRRGWLKAVTGLVRLFDSAHRRSPEGGNIQLSVIGRPGINTLYGCRRFPRLEMVSLAVNVELVMLMLSGFLMGRSRKMSLRIGSSETFYEILQTDCPASGTDWPSGHLKVHMHEIL